MKQLTLWFAICLYCNGGEAYGNARELLQSQISNDNKSADFQGGKSQEFFRHYDGDLLVEFLTLSNHAKLLGYARLMLPQNEKIRENIKSTLEKLLIWDSQNLSLLPRISDPFYVWDLTSKNHMVPMANLLEGRFLEFPGLPAGAKIDSNGEGARMEGVVYDCPKLPLKDAQKYWLWVVNPQNSADVEERPEEVITSLKSASKDDESMCILSYLVYEHLLGISYQAHNMLNSEVEKTRDRLSHLIRYATARQKGLEWQAKKLLMILNLSGNDYPNTLGIALDMTKKWPQYKSYYAIIQSSYMLFQKSSGDVSLFSL